MDRFMNGNSFVKFLIKSPLQFFMGNTMLITVTGCKTGRKITTPVNYYQDDNVLWVISTRSRKWWRNVRTGAAVDLYLRGKAMKGFAEAVSDESEVTTRSVDYVQRLPMSANALGVRIENGIPNCEDVSRLAKERLFVKIQLMESMDDDKQNFSNRAK